MGLLKLGDISMDGTKIKANASKHKAMSWEYACKLEAQLRSEVEELLRRAGPEGGQGQQEINIPAELQRREVRLAKIAEVKAELEQRAAERFAQEQAEYVAKLRSGKRKNNNAAESWGAKRRKHPNQVHRPRIKPTLRTAIHASCQQQVVLSRPITHRPQWTSLPC